MNDSTTTSPQQLTQPSDIGNGYEVCMARSAEMMRFGARILAGAVSDPVFSEKVPGRDGGFTRVSLRLSGVLEVTDGRTGVVLARSLPGRHGTLDPQFIPPPWVY